MRSGIAIGLSGSLAILGGVLILASGARAQSFMLDAVSFVYQREGDVLPAATQPLIKGFILVLSAIILLGGFLAVIGGLAIFRRHFTTGKILVAFGAGSVLPESLFSWVTTFTLTAFRFSLRELITGLAFCSPRSPATSQSLCRVLSISNLKEKRRESRLLRASRLEEEKPTISFLSEYLVRTTATSLCCGQTLTRCGSSVQIRPGPLPFLFFTHKQVLTMCIYPLFGISL